MEKFVVIGHHHQHPTRNLKLNLPKAKHYALVAVKDGEKAIDTKRVIEHAVYKSSMSLHCNTKSDTLFHIYINLAKKLNIFLVAYKVFSSSCPSH